MGPMHKPSRVSTQSVWTTGPQSHLSKSGESQWLRPVDRSLHFQFNQLCAMNCKNLLAPPLKSRIFLKRLQSQYVCSWKPPSCIVVFPADFHMLPNIDKTNICPVTLQPSCVIVPFEKMSRHLETDFPSSLHSPQWLNLCVLCRSLPCPDSHVQTTVGCARHLTQDLQICFCDHHRCSTLSFEPLKWNTFLSAKL